MKILKNSWLRASVMLLLISGIFISLQAMKKASPEVDPQLQFWYFYENVDKDGTNPENYQLTPVKACNGGSEVICIIQAIEDPANLDRPLITDEASRDIQQTLADKMPTQNTVISLRSR